MAYPYLGENNRGRIQGAISGLANPDLFNFLAFLSVAIISLRVIFKGPIVPPLTRIEIGALYWLPGVALGCCAPFFSGVSGFIIGHPASPELVRLSIIMAIGFVWSAGFLLALLLPAHATIFPRHLKIKRDLYIIVFTSFVVAATLFYGT